MVKIIKSEEYARQMAARTTLMVSANPDSLSVFTRLMRLAGSRGEDNPVVAAKLLRDAAQIYGESGHPQSAAKATKFAEAIEQQAKSVRRR